MVIAFLKEAVRSWLDIDYNYQIESVNFDEEEGLSNMMSSNQNMWKIVTQIRTVSSNRQREYQEYDRMEQDVLISSALELYADESTQQNDRGEIAWVESSDDPELAEFLNEKLEDFKVKDKIWSWAYELAKNGEVYEELFDVNNENNGNEGISDYTETVDKPHEVFNLKKKGKTINFAVVDTSETNLQSNKNSIKLYDPYKFVHFCMTASSKSENLTIKDKTNDKEETYKIKRGRGILENIVTTYRILRLLENSMITSRLTRSSILRLFELEVGEKSPKKVRGMVSKFKNLIGSQENFDVDSGLYQTQNNPGPMINPIVVPTKNGVGSINVQEYGGNTDVHGITDIDYFRNKLFAGLKVTKAFLGWEECLRKNTEITFLDGTTRTIGEIVKNKDKYVGKGILSCNTDGKIVPTKIIHAKKTRKDANFVRVHLDNGKYVDATPDHPFMLRDGSFKDAGELEKEDRLMPLYSKIKRGRRHIKDNKTNEWKLEHRLVAETEHGRIPNGYHVHHKNRRKIDNSFDNLELLSAVDHCREHGVELHKAYKESDFSHSDETKQKISEALKGVPKPEHHGRNVSKALTGKPSNNPFKEGENNVLVWNEDARENHRQALLDYHSNGGTVWQQREKYSEEDVLEWQEKIKKARWDGKRIKFDYTVVCNNCGEEIVKHITPDKYEKLLDGIGNVFCGQECQTAMRNQVRAENFYRELQKEYDKVTKEIYSNNKPRGYMLYDNLMEYLNDKPDLKKLSESVNHKVVKVEELDVIEDAYDIGVENESHTFGLMNAGIFVHNSLPGGLGNATLTKLDVRFSRSVKRVIKALEEGIQDLLNIYLIKSGREDEVNKFKVKVTAPVTVEELEKVEELSEKMRVVDDIVSLLDRYIDENDVDLTSATKFLIDRVLKYPDLRKVAFIDEEDKKDNEDDDEDEEERGFRGR